MQDPRRLEEELRIKEEELGQITTGIDRHHQKRTEMREKLDWQSGNPSTSFPERLKPLDTHTWL